MDDSEKKKILVIDDEPHLVAVLKSRLLAHNYDVVTAGDGVEGLEKVAVEKPDLILLDILMPRMDGSTFLHEAKKLGLVDKIPIIVLTAKASMKEFFLVEGAVDFITKPFEAKNLMAEIAYHLGHHDQSS